MESVQFPVANKGSQKVAKKWKSAVCHAAISCNVQLDIFFSCWKLEKKVNGFFSLQ